MSANKFVCDKCSNIDILELAYGSQDVSNKKELLCTRCQTGKWHDLFPEEKSKCNNTKDLVNTKTGIGLG